MRDEVPQNTHPISSNLGQGRGKGRLTLAGAGSATAQPFVKSHAEELNSQTLGRWLEKSRSNALGVQKHVCYSSKK